MPRFLLILLTMTFLTGCAASTSAPTNASQQPTGPTATPAPLDLLTFHTTSYTLGPWPTANGPMPHAKKGPRDSNGIRKVLINGVLYDAPAILAQDAAGALTDYVNLHDPAKLALAEKEAQHLIDIHITNAATGDAWFFPHLMHYSLYGDSHDTTLPPWYSGMAQGEAVYLFTRLYEVTGATSWKTAADHTFHSLLFPLPSGAAPRSRPWATLVDSKGYYWIEEWTTPKPGDDTINGFGFATYGVIEYARAFHDAEAAKVANAALTTYLYATTTARHPGGPSSYSLSHMEKRYTNYHKIVTSQLQVFAAVTGDAQYAALAQEFYQDYH